MLSKLALFAAAIPLAATTAVLSADYAIVDVRETGAEGRHIVVPVPLALARVALAFAPRAAQRLEAPPLASHVKLARAVVDELARIPDHELVRVEERGELVLIRKQGDAIVVDVTSEHEDVHVRIPLAAAREVLEGFDGRTFSTGAALSALKQSDGELVHVRTADNEVSVRIW